MDQNAIINLVSRKIEGLILSKFPYGERNLICHLLLRSGKKVAVVFRGGRGGGKKVKASVLEVGYLLRVELLRRNSLESALAVAKEWRPLWTHGHIRFNYRAFSLACFFLATASKVALEEDLASQDRIRESHCRGTFAVLANGLFYLEKSLATNQFTPSWSVSLFLAKLLLDQGVFPQLGGCIFCHRPFGPREQMHYILEQGGMACENCFPQKNKDNHYHLWQFLVKVSKNSYALLASGREGGRHFGPFAQVLLLSTPSRAEGIKINWGPVAFSCLGVKNIVRGDL